MLVVLAVVYFVGVIWLMRKMPARLLQLVKTDIEQDRDELARMLSTDIIAAVLWPLIVLGGIIYALWGTFWGQGKCP